MLTDLVGPWGQLLSVLVNISWGWLEDWRLEYCKGCLLSGVWAGNIQTAGAGNLRLLRHLSLPGIVCPAWLRAPKVHIPRKRERETRGSLISFYDPALEATKCHFYLTVFAEREALLKRR